MSSRRLSPCTGRIANRRCLMRPPLNMPAAGRLPDPCKEALADLDLAAPLAALAGPDGVALDAVASAANKRLQLQPVRAYADASHASLLGAGAEIIRVNTAVLIHGSTLAHAEGSRLWNHVLLTAGKEVEARRWRPRPVAAQPQTLQRATRQACVVA